MYDNQLNTTLMRIQELLNERNWSLYKLAKVADIPYSSLSSMFQKNTKPTISTLEKICVGMNIVMSDFFDSHIPKINIIPYTHEEQELIELFRSLNSEDRKLITCYLKGYTRKPLSE